MNKILKLWLGKNLPEVHIQKNGGVRKNVADYLIHPIKRHVSRAYLLILQNIFNLTVIGITGSAGKTTTKEMISSVLKLDGKTVWSKDNIDPIFNIPNTILRCTPFTKYLILEMGIEYQGEMDFYLWLARPKIGLITNIYPTHTLYLKDVEGVFREKSKLAYAADIAVLNEDNKYLYSLKNKLNSNIFWFKNGDDANASNLSAARKVCEILNISPSKIERGMNSYVKPKHRLNIVNHKSGAVILDDTYNSNPEALIATLKYFDKLAGKKTKIAVIGDMLELGSLEESEHKRIAKEIKKYNFKKVLGVGRIVRLITPNVYAKAEDVVEEVKKYLKPGVYILFKGSRSIGLDKVVDKL